MKAAKPEGLKIGSLEELVLALCLSSLDKKTPHKIREKKKSGSAGFHAGGRFICGVRRYD